MRFIRLSINNKDHRNGKDPGWKGRGGQELFLYSRWVCNVLKIRYLNLRKNKILTENFYTKNDDIYPFLRNSETLFVLIIIQW